jgi:iron complex outermembrane receptor protein
MSYRLLRASLAGCSAVAIALVFNNTALSQQTEPAAGETLPEIVVQAPSPIQRPHRHRAQPGRTTAAPAPAPASAPNPDTFVGTLPIVTDQFATVTVVPNEEIRRSGSATLGDLLNNKPGITGSSYAPGASSRPIIRGLDVNRVGIVENGIGSNGASDLGEDHFVPIDPLATSQVEVIRGPATLRYGSQSIGGVVSASNNRIPETLPCSAVPSIQTYGYNVKAPVLSPSNPCASFETRSALSSVDLGREGAVLLDVGGNNVAIHADGYTRKTEDYSTPHGIQRNTATQSTGGSIGGSYFFDGGFIGAAVTQTNSLYRIPGTEGEEFGTRIDAKQTKLTVKGDYHPDSKAIDVIRFWAGATDYKHNELGRTDPADFSTDGVRQTFTNKEQEGRVEVQFAPLNLRFASLTTAVGAQASHQELTAPSPDDPGSPLNGLWDPNKNTRVAGYIFNEFKFSDVTKAQVAGRIEHVNLSGTTPAFVPDLFDLNVDPAAIGPATPRNLNFTPVSGSVGLIQNCRGISRPASPANTPNARRSLRSCSRAADMMPPRPSISAIRISGSRPRSRLKSGCAARRGHSASNSPATTHALTASSIAGLPATPAKM